MNIEMEYRDFADDRIMIPDWIKNMTEEELDQLIAQLEEEHRQETAGRRVQTVATAS